MHDTTILLDITFKSKRRHFLGETLRFRSMLGIFIVTLHTTIFQWDSIATAGMINKYAFQCLRTDGRGRRIEASRCHLWLLDIIVFRWDAIYFKVRLLFFLPKVNLKDIFVLLNPKAWWVICNHLDTEVNCTELRNP